MEANNIEPDFLKELGELLAKYNAEIYTDVDGDTHGVSAFVVVDINNKEVLRSRSWGEISQYTFKP